MACVDREHGRCISKIGILNGGLCRRAGGGGFDFYIIMTNRDIQLSTIFGEIYA